MKTPFCRIVASVMLACFALVPASYGAKDQDDDSNLNAGQRGSTWAADYIGTTHHGRSKSQHGIDGFARDTSFKDAIPVTVGGGAGTDAFGRLRVSSPHTLFEARTEYDKQLIIWAEKVTGTASATHDADNSGVTLAVGATTADSIIRQTYEYFRYYSGKSQEILITFGFGTLDTHLRARAGYFDANNGVFYENHGGASSVVLRSKVTGSVVDDSFAQADWNLDTLLDGTGPSGITLSPTKSQVFIADLEWLSVGRVRAGFVIDGNIVYVHEFLNANAMDAAYMTTANLPIRYEFTNVTGGTGASITALCATVISEGGTSFKGLDFAAGNAATTIAVTTRRPITSIRPKATFNSIVNRGKIVANHIDLINSTTDAFIEIVYGGTLTGASFASVDDDSIVEVDVAATAITGGIVIDSFYATAATNPNTSLLGANKASNEYPLTLDIDGANPFNLSVVVTGMGGTSNIAAEINFFEIR